MVGRAEVITPEMEAETMQQVRALGSQEFDAREKASRALARLGRFAEPTLKRVIETSTDAEVKARAEKLIEDAHAVGK